MSRGRGTMIDEVFQLPDARFSDLERTVAQLERTVSSLRREAERDRATQGRLRSLLDASVAVAGDIELDSVLKRIAESATTLVNARYGALGVLHPDGHIERLIQTGTPSVDGGMMHIQPGTHDLLQAVSESHGPIRLDNLREDPRSVGFPPGNSSIRSFLGVPVRVRGEVLGNLYLADRRDGGFTKLDEELVVELAETAGVAIDNARRFEETCRKQRLAAALSEVASTLLSAGAEDVLAAVTSKVAMLLPATLVAVVVPGPGENEMRVEAADGVQSEKAVGTVFPALGSLSSQAVVSGTVMSSESGHEIRSAGGSIGFGPVTAVPLVVSGRAIGALCVAREPGGPGLTRGEKDTISEFAVQAGLAVALAWARLDRQRLEVIEDHARIARDLHDNVIQRLFATGLGLQALAASDPTHAAAIDTHTLEIDAAISDIRSAVFTRLSAPPSDATRVRHRVLDVIIQLTPALGSPPRVAFSGCPNMVIPRRLADDVVAVIRESLTNVAKHAQAETTAIDVKLGDSGVSITVDDDGIGVDSRVERASGTGNLARRAERHGGTFTLEPREPRGTRAYWNVSFGEQGDQ
ncbi:histidine kinase [Mycetocola zhujimingii]|nr:histidine kinase [Mycetocola zhujimingii]